MGFSNEEKSMRYFTVRDGKFWLSMGKGKDPEPYTNIDGALGEHNLYDKPVKGFKDKHVLRIVLIDDELKLSIECGQESTFAKMYAGHLPGITKGERIQLRIKSNDRNDKVGSCFVSSWNGTEYKKVEYISFKDDQAGAIKAIRDHDAFENWKPSFASDQGGDEEHANDAFKRGSAEELAFVACIAKANWPAFAPNEAAYEEWFGNGPYKNGAPYRCGDTNPATWGYFKECAEACIAKNVVPKIIREKATAKPFDPTEEDDVPHPADQKPAFNPDDEGGVQTPVNPPVGDTPPAWAVGTANASLPDPVPVAYGWRPIKWFLPRHAFTPASDGQKKQLTDAGARLAKLFDKPATEIHVIRRGLLASLGWSAKGAEMDSIAGYQLAIEFLTSAADSQLAQAQFDGEQIDPFAEQ